MSEERNRRRREARAKAKAENKAASKKPPTPPPAPPAGEGDEATPSPPMVLVQLVEIADGEYGVADVVTTPPIRVREAQHFLEEGIKHVRRVFNKP